MEQGHLVGHSFGADICMFFALKYPERVAKLIALEPGLAALVAERVLIPHRAGTGRKCSKIKEASHVGASRSLVAHLPWAQGAGGSNPLAPTIENKSLILNGRVLAA